MFIRRFLAVGAMPTAGTGEQMSLNARKAPGYTSVTFLLGCDDKDSEVGGSAVLQATFTVFG